MTNIVARPLTCPVCGETFDGFVILSVFISGRTTTDFRVVSDAFNPLPYEVQTCSACGFSGSADLFMGKKLNAEVVRKVNQQIRPTIEHGDPPDWRRFEFAAQIAIWRRQPAFKVGWLYLKAAWCCIAAEMEQEEIACRRASVKYFERAVSSRMVPDAEKALYCYLIGEQYRRIGDRASAAGWFTRVADYDTDGEDERRLADLAVQQAKNPKEFID